MLDFGPNPVEVNHVWSKLGQMRPNLAAEARSHEGPAANDYIGRETRACTEKECKAHGTTNNVPSWVNLDAGMRNYFDTHNVLRPGPISLRRMLETIQIDDPDHDSLVNTFVEMKWLGDELQQEWLAT